MTDGQVVQPFESCELPGDQFPHQAHMRVAWCYLKRERLLFLRCRDSATRCGAPAQSKPERYHETITIAYMLLLRAHEWDAR